MTEGTGNCGPAAASFAFAQVGVWRSPAAMRSTIAAFHVQHRARALDGVGGYAHNVLIAASPSLGPLRVPAGPALDRLFDDHVRHVEADATYWLSYVDLQALALALAVRVELFQPDRESVNVLELGGDVVRREHGLAPLGLQRHDQIVRMGYDGNSHFAALALQADVAGGRVPDMVSRHDLFLEEEQVPLPPAGEAGAPPAAGVVASGLRAAAGGLDAATGGLASRAAEFEAASEARRSTLRSMHLNPTSLPAVGRGAPFLEARGGGGDADDRAIRSRSLPNPPACRPTCAIDSSGEESEEGGGDEAEGALRHARGLVLSDGPPSGRTRSNARRRAGGACRTAPDRHELDVSDEESDPASLAARGEKSLGE